ncbi:hypothetical protein [Micromonospora globispora]|nr:hypothetical protein [Micromonospora globispora]
MNRKRVALLALGFYLAGVSLTFKVRTFLQWRTGDSGLRTDAGAVGSIGW